VLCSHGPVLPDVLGRLRRLVDRCEPGAGVTTEQLWMAQKDKMAKGEALVAHVVGTGAQARVVAVERHHP
jgi:8-oxo-dGTP diphosphatase